MDSIKYSPDFYSTSGVRDLLFHVKEHRFTIPKIKKIMKKLNIKFLGFEDTYVLDRFKKKYETLMNTTLKVHNLMGCRGVTRSDFRYYRGKFYLLEINTQPGMTKLSLVPEISAYIGINFINLIKLILKDASINK